MNFLKKTVSLLIISLGLSIAASAQHKTLKIGHTNIYNVLSQLPDAKRIENEIKTYRTQLENQLQTKYKEYQDKLAAYQKGEALMSEPVKADKQKELQFLQNSIQEFEQNAETSLQKKQQTLLQPVQEQIEKAIKSVADELGYTYVLNSEGGILLHSPESDDITNLVLKKLGVTPAPKVTEKKEEAPKTTAPVNSGK